MRDGMRHSHNDPDGEAAMQSDQLDDRDIIWGTIGVLSKFQANAPGKLRFWRPAGSLREIRPTGCYGHGPANRGPHADGAGNRAAIALHSIRAGTGDIVAVSKQGPDEVNKRGLADVRAALADQVATGAAAKIASEAA
jgi:hypothetical protein